MRLRAYSRGPRCRGKSARPAERLGELQPVRVVEGQIRVTPELVALLPGDQSVLPVFPDHRHEIATEAFSGLYFLDIHEKACVTTHGQHPPFGEYQARGQGAGQREAHRAEAVGDQACVGLVTVIVPHDPHLMRTNVGQQDVVWAEHLPCVPDCLLGSDAALGLVILALGGVCPHLRPDLALIARSKPHEANHVAPMLQS